MKLLRSANLNRAHTASRRRLGKILGISKLLCNTLLLRTLFKTHFK